MAAVRSAAISAAAVVAPRGFGRRRRLVPCLAAPARGASGVTASASGKMLPRSALHASASTTGAPDSDEAAAESLVEAELSKLACPICYYPLVSSIDHQSAPSKSDSSLECSTCKKLYSKDDYWDLTVAVGSTEYSETMPAATELFRTQLVSFLYERGWRQNFIWGGFPGLEKEFEMAKDYLKPKSGGIIIDASCGSGLFSRLFVKSELYCLVVALDFSENMLKQCKEFIKQENISDECCNSLLAIPSLCFIKIIGNGHSTMITMGICTCPLSHTQGIDISKKQDARNLFQVAEISRVLRPGGVFVGSTFIADVLPPVIPLLRIGRPYIDQITGNNTFLSELELEDLCSACGLVNFTFVRNGFYIMFSATKAS
uniref:Methyltransferase type 11 domain-containing protein n=1 Tax=Triticum urartu TaxID=4572 RepID=A0A8R7QUW4_TRIUA